MTAEETIPDVVADGEQTVSQFAGAFSFYLQIVLSLQFFQVVPLYCVLTVFEVLFSVVVVYHVVGEVQVVDREVYFCLYEQRLQVRIGVLMFEPLQLDDQHLGRLVHFDGLEGLIFYFILFYKS